MIKWITNFTRNLFGLEFKAFFQKWEMRGILAIGIAMETCSLILNEYQMPF
jgi:hypothetical protein